MYEAPAVETGALQTGSVVLQEAEADRIGNTQGLLKE
jgi:hypothetical protein